MLYKVFEAKQAVPTTRTRAWCNPATINGH
jgi:hypothetical protein